MKKMVDTQNIRSEAELLGALPPHVAADYMALKRDLDTVINNYAPQKGSGSPEGVVTANFNGIYFDTSTNPVTMYINDFGNKTGWKQL